MTKRGRETDAKMAFSQLCQRPVIEALCRHLNLDDVKALSLVCRRLCDAVSPLMGELYVMRVQNADQLGRLQRRRKVQPVSDSRRVTDVTRASRIW